MLATQSSFQAQKRPPPCHRLQFSFCPLRGEQFTSATGCYERFRIGWLKSTPRSLEFVSCIQAEEPSDGRLLVGSWNRPLPQPANRSSSSQSTLPSRVTTPSFALSSTSVRRLLSWQGAFRTSWASCEHAIVGPARYVRWRPSLPASVLFLLNLRR